MSRTSLSSPPQGARAALIGALVTAVLVAAAPAGAASLAPDVAGTDLSASPPATHGAPSALERVASARPAPIPERAVSVGTVAFVGPYADDGYINAAEAAAPDPGGRPVAWSGPSGGPATGRFADSSGTTITGGDCGPFALPSSGTGYLNVSCMAAAPQGEISFRVVWVAGDESSDSIVVDTIAPTASIDLLDGDGKVSTPEAGAGVPVSWTVSEAGPPVVVTASETGQAAPADCTYAAQPRGPVTGAITPACFDDLADGPIEVAVGGTDLAGNPASALDASVLDTLGPALPSIDIVPPFINLANQAAVDVLVDGESGALADVTLEDENGNTLSQSVVLASPATLPFDATSLVDGTVTGTVVLTDGDGNQSAPATDSVIKDTIGPGIGTVAFTGPYADDGYINASEAAAPDPAGRPVTWTGPLDAASAQGRFTDAPDHIIEGGTCGPFGLAPIGTGTDGYLNLSCMNAALQGPISWEVRWFDAAGNPSGWASTSLVKDTLGPPVTIVTPANGSTLPVAPVAVTGTTDAGAPLSYSLDLVPAGTGTAEGDGSFETTLAAPTEGTHVLTVSASDPIGNVTEAISTFIVDRCIPFIIKPDDDSLNTGQVSVYGTGEPVSRIELYEVSLLIGSTQVTSLGEWHAIVGLPTGNHSIRARAIDTQGIVCEWSNSRSFRVDASRPGVTITSGNPSLFLVNPAEIVGKGTDDKGVMRVEIQYFNLLGGDKVLTEDATCPTCGQAAPSVDWTATPELMLPGFYSAHAVAIDEAGNRSVAASILFFKAP